MQTVHSFKRAENQDFRAKVGDFAIFRFKKGAVKHQVDSERGEVLNVLFGLQTGPPPSFNTSACVQSLYAPFFDAPY